MRVNGNNQIDLVVASTATVQNIAAWSSTDPTHFGSAASWLIGAGSSYVGLQSAATSVDSTSPGTGVPLLIAPNGSPLTATILAGNNTGNFTGGNPANVTMARRTTTPDETGLYNGGTPTSPPLPHTYSPLISNVVQILGMGTGSDEPTETDPFVLQKTYDQALLRNESYEARHGGLYLGWLNPTGGPGDVPLWQNAVLGDTGNNATQAEQDFQGSFATFQSEIDDTNLADYIGAWGVDPANHDVWAVIDHNSEFAVVPEPSSLLLGVLALGGLVLLLRARARCRRVAVMQSAAERRAM